MCFSNWCVLALWAHGSIVARKQFETSSPTAICRSAWRRGFSLSEKLSVAVCLVYGLMKGFLVLHCWWCAFAVFLSSCLGGHFAVHYSCSIVLLLLWLQLLIVSLCYCWASLIVMYDGFGATYVLVVVQTTWWCCHIILKGIAQSIRARLQVTTTWKAGRCETQTLSSPTLLF